MTASKTPNLGLMNPVGSDAFTVADFSSTFGVLDQNPGILVVPNQASRPTGWGTNQHGRHVWQADQNVEWVWNQPTSSVAGVWQRRGPKGHLGGAAGGTVSTANPTVGAGPVALSATVLVPGGRPLNVVVGWAGCLNETSGSSFISLWENGTLIAGINAFGRNFSDPLSHWISGTIDTWTNPAPTTQTSVTYQVQVNPNNNINPPGTTSLMSATISIYEV